MTIINVCNLFAPIVGPLIGIINIIILILLINRIYFLYPTLLSNCNCLCFLCFVCLYLYLFDPHGCIIMQIKNYYY